MRILKLTALATTFLLGACGGDSGSSPSREDGNSSSSGNASSASQSSSSATEDPADSTRAATLADLLPVMDLGDELGYQVRYVLGASGVYSKFYYRNDSLKAHMAGLYALDASGLMLADTLRSGTLSYSTELLPESVKADLKAAPQRLFRVQKTSGVLYAGKSRADWKAVKAATFTSTSKYVTQSSEVQGLFTYSSQDTSMTYRMYADGSYVRTGRLLDTLWEAGYYAVQNQYLVTVPVATYAIKDALGIANFMRANSTGSWSEVGTKTAVAYTRADLTPAVSAQDLQGHWTVTLEQRTWDLTLGAQTAALEVNSTDVSVENALYKDSGRWLLLGDYLLLDFKYGSQVCSGDQSIGDGAVGAKNCFGFLLGAVSLDQGQVSLSQADLPASWTLQK